MLLKCYYAQLGLHMAFFIEVCSYDELAHNTFKVSYLCNIYLHVIVLLEFDSYCQRISFCTKFAKADY